mmetsp:Transcript_5564/g.10446  ORF Transcript_5564/g.10446 Transcript_5564/m.10446 type:complete len:81 (-) Transcript_5564:1049-1291(-)
MSGGEVFITQFSKSPGESHRFRGAAAGANGSDRRKAVGEATVEARMALLDRTPVEAMPSIAAAAGVAWNVRRDASNRSSA